MSGVSEVDVHKENGAVARPVPIRFLGDSVQSPSAVAGLARAERSRRNRRSGCRAHNGPTRAGRHGGGRASRVDQIQVEPAVHFHVGQRSLKQSHRRQSLRARRAASDNQTSQQLSRRQSARRRNRGRGALNRQGNFVNVAVSSLIAVAGRRKCHDIFSLTPDAAGHRRADG